MAAAPDRLSVLLARFRLTAGTFYSGHLCGTHPFERDAARGHLHLVKEGPVEFIGADGRRTPIERPSVVFLPRAEAHRLVADDGIGAQVVCASVQFGGGGGNPIARSLPALLLVPLDEMRGVDGLLHLLYEEAFSGGCGRLAALDRLCELLVLRLLRHCLERGLADGGLMAGLSDDRLARAIVAI
jgi:cupin